MHKPVLAPGPSAELRDQLIGEVNLLKDGEELALWAHRRLPAKNTLTGNDARLVEAAYGVLLAAEDRSDQLSTPSQTASSETANPTSDDELVTLLRKPIRGRNKAHLMFVVSQPCLVCQRSPCDAHHLKFAEPRALGRKVSDEYTVPLCRDHHQQLHRHGNEAGWWSNVQTNPLEVALDLWTQTELNQSPAIQGRKPERNPNREITVVE
jgi:hypothetical protein